MVSGSGVVVLKWGQSLEDEQTRLRGYGRDVFTDEWNCFGCSPRMLPECLTNVHIPCPFGRAAKLSLSSDTGDDLLCFSVTDDLLGSDVTDDLQCFNVTDGPLGSYVTNWL